jgi:hypothetical protein
MLVYTGNENSEKTEKKQRRCPPYMALEHDQCIYITKMFEKGKYKNL